MEQEARPTRNESPNLVSKKYISFVILVRYQTECPCGLWTKKGKVGTAINKVCMSVVAWLPQKLKAT